MRIKRNILIRLTANIRRLVVEEEENEGSAS